MNLIVKFRPFDKIECCFDIVAVFIVTLSQKRCTSSTLYKNSPGDEIADVNFLTTISHTRRPTSKYRKRDKPTLFNKLDDR